MKFGMIWKPLSATTDQSRVRTVAENQAITVNVASLSCSRKDQYSSAVQSRQVAAQPRISVLKVNRQVGHWLPSGQLRHTPRATALRGQYLVGCGDASTYVVICATPDDFVQHSVNASAWLTSELAIGPTGKLNKPFLSVDLRRQKKICFR